MPIKRRSAKAKLSQPATWDTLLELERCFLLDEPMPPDPADVHYGHEWSLAAALRAVGGNSVLRRRCQSVSQRLRICNALTCCCRVRSSG